MLSSEITQMYEILVSFLGPSKYPLDDSLQLQFSCPRCQDRDGSQERHKFHLEVNLSKGYFNCWKCSSIDEGMHGSVYKLIRQYGNPELLQSYKDAIKAFRNSSLYKLSYSQDEFALAPEDNPEDTVSFPKNYIKFKKGVNEDRRALEYLFKRGLDWRIIDEYSIGFTTYHKDDKSLSNRIILPSFDEYGNINYWTGRDFTGNPKRQRYFNPHVERKDIIFNEEKIEWNADITLVEGPFDHIVVPNSIPLLGKALSAEYKIFRQLYSKCNANINIWLDADCPENIRCLYSLLNNGRLTDKIKVIFKGDGDKDPSEIFQHYARKGIIEYINSAKKNIKELLI